MLKKAAWVIFVLLYWATLYALGGLRGDHYSIGAVILTLALLQPWTTQIFRFIWPLLLTGIIYDSQRFYSDYLRGEIHVAFPYDFDKYWFGIETAAGRLTPNEWWQLNIHPAIDLITGLAYLVFVGVFVLTCAWWCFGLVRLHGIRLRGAWDTMWGFFWLNMLGYSTYYWFPAAPPWYVAKYGLGPADLTAQASAAGCARFDELLGTQFFTGMYGRSADVFGAIPSLHVAYPFLAILYAFQFKSLRAFTVSFYLLMCFSAVYLNHHYIIDLIWGTAYAIIIYAIFRATARYRHRT